MDDSIASAAVDDVMGEAAQPSLLDRLAIVERQLEIVSQGHIHLADLIRRLAESETATVTRLGLAEINVAGIAEVASTAANLVHDLVQDRVQHAEQITGFGLRLDAVERRTKPRQVFPGRP